MSQDSEVQFRALTENSSSAIFIAQGERVVYANPAAETITGYSRDEILSIPFWEILHPDMRGLAKERARARALGEESPKPEEYMLLAKNGETRWVDYSACPFVFRGQPAILGTAVDITGRKRTEEALRASEAKYRMMAENISDMVWTMGLDERFTYLNPAFERVLGYSLAEGRSYSLREVLTPESYDRAAAAYRKQQQEASPEAAQAVIPLGMELEHLRKDGSIVICEVRALWLPKRKGRRVELIGVTRDITDRKRAEQALRESEERFRELAELLPEIVFETDERGVLTFANHHAYAISGYSREDFERGFSAIDFFAPVDRERVARDVAESLAGKGSSSHEYIAQRKDGATFPVIANSAVIVRNGRTAGLRGIAINVTPLKKAEEERRQLEEQMLQMQKLESLGVLAGGIAHDFNNLLMGILGHAELALDDLAPDSPAYAGLREIDQAAMRAAELCRQLLAYSGKGRFVIESLDLSACIREMAHLLEAASSKRVRMVYDFAPTLPSVRGDATQIRQVIMNLITNAAEAVGKHDGRVRVTTGTMDCNRSYLATTFLGELVPEGRYVYIEVMDTGCGMDADTLKRVFDPFFTTKFTGRGLGLAAVLGIVRGHKGTIHIETALGRGSTFRVLLPMAAAGEGAGPRPGGGRAPAWRGDGVVLLIDDEAPVRAVAKRMLERLGFSVLTAADGQEALTQFAAHRQSIVCVLLDLTMPRMNGEQTLQELRRIDPDVRVLLSSGYTQQEITERSSLQGMTGFVQKPYKLSALTEKLRNALENQT